MDLTGIAKFDSEYTVDPIAGYLTIKIINSITFDVIGEITIEPYKARAFIDSLAEITRSIYPIVETTWTRRSDIDKNSQIATTRMSAPL